MNQMRNQDEYQTGYGYDNYVSNLNSMMYNTP